MPKKKEIILAQKEIITSLEGKIAIQDKQIASLIKELSCLRSLIEAVPATTPDPGAAPKPKSVAAPKSDAAPTPNLEM